jgi:hypothetical protein
VTNDPAVVLRLYASVFEKPRRDPVNGMHPPSEFCTAAAICLRIIADAIERRDPFLPPWMLP